MTDCIFCQIINKEIPSYAVYEDEQIYAFLDISQATKGHTLVVPKKHLTDIFDYDKQLASDVFSRIPKIARGLELALPTMNGLNILNNNRALAYQSVFHSHIHLIPRYSKNDDFSIHFGNNQDNYTTDEMTSVAQMIRQEVAKQ